ncbi:unnamed protein product [Owenia fusiformis]|uniref:BTB domain-containing protein n=1 Tax=Owenia fusiformis TaxID=6347 RepID=A0A8S4NXQ6_OWEFU|nr:unnamed protein product [Owenia fusiformis]
MATSELSLTQLQEKLKIEDKETTKENYFHKPWPGSDIAFLMDDEKRVYASKAVLTMVSPVFETMFNSDFKEKEASEIPLPGKKSEDIVALMEVIHPKTWANVTESTIEPLLKLAREYQMEQLTKKCGEFLNGCKASFHNLYLADEYNLRMARHKNMNYAHTIPLSKLHKYPEFMELSKKCTDSIILMKAKLLSLMQIYLKILRLEINMVCYMVMIKLKQY